MSKLRYNPPPSWPAPPAGWAPGPTWQPDPAWGPAPAGWKLYVDDRNWFLRHKIVTGLLGFVLLAIIGNALGSGSKGTSTPTAASDNSGAAAPAAPAAKVAPAATKAPAAKKMSGLNKPVRDGNFEFTVKSMKCGISQVGDSALGQKAQGQFCFVKMHVSNIGKDSQMLDGSSQTAFDAEGRKFSADTGAAIYLGQDAQTFLNDINPGNAVDGTVIFDVPKNVKITELELHDSAFSGGVKVQVG